ncbi:hypothetical protein HC928_00395 [bacterium]|nr:hypothetical protein [bacterium]
MPALPTINARYIKRIRDLLRTGPNYSAASLQLGSGTSALLIEAQEPGLVGNAITIQVTVPTGTADLAVSVSGAAITVALAVSSGTPVDASNTATLIAAAVNASAAASALVRAFVLGSGAGSLSTAVPATALSGGAQGANVSSVATYPLNFLRAQDMASVLELMQDSMTQTTALTTTANGSTTTLVDGAGSFVPGQQVGNLVRFKGDTTTVALRGLSFRILGNDDRTLRVETMPAATVNGDTYEILGGIVDAHIDDLREGKGLGDSPSGNIYGDYRIVQDALLQFTRKLRIVQATGTLTFTGNALSNETVVIGGKTYTFQGSLTNADGNVLIGANAAASRNNLLAAINLGSGGGTTYAAATVLHPSVRAAAGVGDTLVVTAKVATGAAGNTIATTETLTNGSWGAATLVGGVSGVTLAERSVASLLTAANSTKSRIQLATAVPGPLRVDQFKGMRATISGASRLILGNDESSILLDGELAAAPAASVAVAIVVPEDATAPAMAPGRVHPGGQPMANRTLAQHLAQAEAAVVAYTLPT